MKRLIGEVDIKCNIEILLDEDYVNVRYDSDNKIIIWEPLDKMNSEQFRHSFEVGVEKFKDLYNKGIKINWLNIVEKLHGADAKDIKWIDTEVNKWGDNYGVKKVAFTTPINVLAFGGIFIYMNFSKISKRNLETKRFENKEDAMKWLKD